MRRQSQALVPITEQEEEPENEEAAAALVQVRRRPVDDRVGGFLRAGHAINNKYGSPSRGNAPIAPYSLPLACRTCQQGRGCSRC